ncbi:DNA integrity scanning protein DisA [Pseudobythopirellula maris]|uniref:DNA integrity scanning protein DisA n=1 Tax=Pseudobythopirellula maris TaxID=2527991 RepID=A0A5C5ZKX0_9BACT|nr:DNA integrity scanning protein DisA nucleotide-binding domain protein [Pseudobythopirellula maris]TWT87451.1 DNA integrity scanning protein DisA [Pseudobythopirellula maris]
MAPPKKFSDQLQAFCESAVRLAELHDAKAILFLVERPTDWERLEEAIGKHTLIVAADTEEELTGALGDDAEGSFDTIVLNSPESSVYERLTQALLEAVAEEFIGPSDAVVAAYSGFESGTIDSLSLIQLDDYLGRLTIRDLRQLNTKTPTETLKLVVDLAVEIGREGREGKPVGALFVVGEHRKALEYCKPMGFDPVKGYSATERNLFDAKVREGVKEIAQMDGAFIVSSKGTVMASAQHLAPPPSSDISISKGLGARHWAAAQISRALECVALAVSESNGTVRLFQNGEVVLRIEPFRRAMKWKDFETDAPDRPEKEGKAKEAKSKDAKSKKESKSAKTAKKAPKAGDSKESAEA